MRVSALADACVECRMDETEPEQTVDVREPADAVRDHAAEAHDRDSEVRAWGSDLSRTWLDAEARDRAAEARDLAAEARDRESEARDLALTGVGLPAVIHSTAAMDRAAAADDRRRAAADRAAAAQERVASSFDELTGAYRRTPGMVEARREVARTRRLGQDLAVVFLDVDGLKAVNDSGGHLVGDALLREVGRQLRRSLREYDLVVRYGGDEFVCLLSDTGAEDAARRVDAVNATLRTGSPSGSVSYGVVALEPGDSVEDALRRADAAMYDGRRARRAGPSRR